MGGGSVGQNLGHQLGRQTGNVSQLRNQKSLTHFKMGRFIRDNLLTMATLCGAIAGVALGLSLKSMGDGIYTPRQASYVGYPGKLFLNMLKCLIIPLVVPSLIASIGSLDFRMSGKVGLRAVCYYMTTTLIAVTLGILLTITIRPGLANTEMEQMDKELDVEKSKLMEIVKFDEEHEEEMTLLVTEDTKATVVLPPVTTPTEMTYSSMANRDKSKCCERC